MVKSVDVEEYLKRVITQEEADEAVADFRRVSAEFDKANLEYPLPAASLRTSKAGRHY
jgi:hypothetical protein